MRDGQDKQSIGRYLLYQLLRLWPFQVLIGQLQVKVELSLLFLEFGELGDKLTGFLQSAKDTSMNKIKDHSLSRE